MRNGRVHGPTPPPADKTCDFCGRPPDRMLYERDGFRIVECHRCRIAWVGNPPDLSDLETIYDVSFFESLGDKPGRTAYLANAERKRKDSRRRIRDLENLRQEQEPGRLLDIGCATGFFLEAARDRGWQVHGIEVSPYAGQIAREALGEEAIHIGTTDGAPWPDGTFDLVTLWACIEHVPNPRHVLDQAIGWLRPGGLLVVNTGDWHSLGSRLTGSRWRLMTPPQHLYFFSRRFMRQWLEQKGLEILDVSTEDKMFAWRLLSRSVAQRWIRRLKLGDVMTVTALKPQEGTGLQRA